MPQPKTPAAESEAVATIIREELARRRMSRAGLAAQARISLSSLEKALSGQRPFSPQALVRIEDALNLQLRAAANQQQHAPEWLGSYSRPAVNWIEGEYLTIRPSASDLHGLYVYRTEISWDKAAGHLVFRESERLDTAYAQAGSVSIPHQTGHVYLVTSKHGQYRLVILSRPTITGEMFGVLTTLQTGRGSQLTPSAMPVALVAANKLNATAATGKIDASHQRYAEYAALLRRATEESFALLHAAPAT